MYEEVAFLPFFTSSTLYQFLITSNMHDINMQHDLSFHRRHGETVLHSSIANQHRLTFHFIFIWIMADILLSS